MLYQNMNSEQCLFLHLWWVPLYLNPFLNFGFGFLALSICIDFAKEKNRTFYFTNRYLNIENDDAWLKIDILKKLDT